MSKYFGKFFGPSTRGPKFLIQMPQLFIIKICFTIKVYSVCVARQDTWNLRHKFSSQDPALRILGLRVAISKSQGPISRVLSIRVPCTKVPVTWSQMSGFRVPGSLLTGSQIPGSQVSESQVPGLRSRFQTMPIKPYLNE